MDHAITGLGGGERAVTVSAPPLPPSARLELADGTSVLLRSAGSPTAPATVVLLHGWTASADLCWHEALAPLAARWRVLAPDLPGHGAGSRPQRATIAGAVDEVLALLATIDGPVVVVGWSMGGLIALEVARRAPTAPRGLVVVATAAVFPTLRRGRSLRAVAAHLPLGLLPKRLHRAVAARSWGGRRDDRPIQAWALDELARADLRLVAQLGVELAGVEAELWLREVEVPVEVVVTTSDHVVPAADQRALAAALPRAHVVEVPVGHGAFIEEPGPVVDVLVEAVARLVADDA